jgi:hypothetical protein
MHPSKPAIVGSQLVRAHLKRAIVIGLENSSCYSRDDLLNDLVLELPDFD